MGAETSAERALIEVVAGVLHDGQGRVLLARRPEGKHLAGTWEFPGGKREPGESGVQALVRELDEELGITVGRVRPWLALTHRYPEVAVRLQLYTIDHWQGEPRGREGQPLRWAGREEMRRLPMPAADRPIVRALGLADRYVDTPDPRSLDDDGLLAWTRASLDRGIRLYRLRSAFPDEAARVALAGRFGRTVSDAGACWLLDGPPELAIEARADGVHISSERLGRLTQRPVDADLLVAASCRDEAALTRAGELGLDFVTISADAEAPDWEAFARLCRCSPLPVYAQGAGLAADFDRVRQCGGFGLALDGEWLTES